MHKIRSGTWWATLAGSAIHELTEKIDLHEFNGGDRLLTLDDVAAAGLPTFQEEFDKQKEQALKFGNEIKASGRVTKAIGVTGGPNKKDYDWWLHFGPLYVQNWLDWKAESQWVLATLPDGSPGIEVAIGEKVAGRSHLGFIDRVYVSPEGEAIVVDLKTGATPPGRLQLAVYGMLLYRKYGLRAGWGTYWMAKDGQCASMTDLTTFSDEYLEAQYEMAWKGIEAGVFLPNVSSMCSGCGVKDYCRAVAGRLSSSIPIRDEMQITSVSS